MRVASFVLAQSLLLVLGACATASIWHDGKRYSVRPGAEFKLTSMIPNRSAGRHEERSRLLCDGIIETIQSNRYTYGNEAEFLNDLREYVCDYIERLEAEQAEKILAVIGRLEGSCEPIQSRSMLEYTTAANDIGPAHLQAVKEAARGWLARAIAKCKDQTHLSELNAKIEEARRSTQRRCEIELDSLNEGDFQFEGESSHADRCENSEESEALARLAELAAERLGILQEKRARREREAAALAESMAREEQAQKEAQREAREREEEAARHTPAYWAEYLTFRTMGLLQLQESLQLHRQRLLSMGRRARELEEDATWVAASLSHLDTAIKDASIAYCSDLQRMRETLGTKGVRAVTGEIRRQATRTMGLDAMKVIVRVYGEETARCPRR